MADPISALGVAAAALQFVDFAGKLLSDTAKIYRAHERDDPSAAQFNLPVLTTQLVRLNDELLNSTEASQDQDLSNLCEQCSTVARRLIEVLERLGGNQNASHGSGSARASVWDSFLQALRTLWKESEIRVLRETLDSFRSQISMQILLSLRYAYMLKLLANPPD